MIITSKFTEEQVIRFLSLIRPNIIEILREKKENAKLIRFNNQQYIIQHPSQMRSNQNLKKKAK